jgi:hypothetical protein
VYFEVPDPDSEAGSKKEKITNKNRKKVKKCHVLKCWMSFFEGWRLLL